MNFMDFVCSAEKLAFIWKCDNVYKYLLFARQILRDDCDLYIFNILNSFNIKLQYWICK